MSTPSDSGHDRAGEGERALDRVLTFVDAVVAIAITLLVLPLAELATDLKPHGSVSHLVGDHLGQIYGFLLSFVVILRLWFAQHAVVRHVARQDKRVVALLMLWLLMIVFLPFPTALLANASDQALTKILYLGCITVASATLAAIAYRVTTVASLQRFKGHPDVIASLVSTGGFLIALVLSLAIPVLGYWPLLLLVVTDPIADRLRPFAPERFRRGTVSPDDADLG